MEIYTNAESPVPPVVLLPDAREIINRTLRKTGSQNEKTEPVQIHGVLRAVDLNQDWILINTEDGPVQVRQMGEVVDDTIGPFVNHRVVVEAIKAKKGRLVFKDIQPDE
jgi:hypothetical protein